MVTTSDTGRLYAFRRVFKCTAKSGQKVRIQGLNCRVGKKTELFLKSIQRAVFMLRTSIVSIDNRPASNIVGLVGINQSLSKSGTINTSEATHVLKIMKFLVSPQVQIAVEVKKSNKLFKLIEGLKILSKSDPYVLASLCESGEHIKKEQRSSVNNDK